MGGAEHSYPNRGGIPGSERTFFDFGGLFYRENSPVESFMRWVLMGSFEHSN